MVILPGLYLTSLLEHLHPLSGVHVRCLRRICSVTVRDHITDQDIVMRWFFPLWSLSLETRILGGLVNLQDARQQIAYNSAA